jgi:hypothetical protein
LAAHKGEQLLKLTQSFQQDLEHQWLVPGQNADNIESVLAVVRQVEPRSPLLQDSRLPETFRKSAAAAIETGQVGLAHALVVAGSRLNPFDSKLAALGRAADKTHEDSQAQEGNSQAGGVRAAAAGPPGAVREQIQAGLARATLSLSQARYLSQLIEQFGRSDASAAGLRHTLETRLLHSVEVVNQKQGLDAAVTFAKGACALLPQSHELSQALTGLLTFVAQNEAARRDRGIEGSRSEIERLLTDPVLDAVWEEALHEALTQLGSYAPATDAYVADTNKRTAVAYLQAAKRLRGSGHLDDAAAMLERARHYDSASADANTEEALLADARTKQSMGAGKSDRTSYINSLRHRLLAQAQSDDIDAALMSLRVLQENLAPDDHFLTKEAPTAIAQAYARRAQKAFAGGQLKDAVELIGRARMAAPAVERVEKAQTVYVHYHDLNEYLSAGPVPDVHRVRHEISELYSQDPDAAQWGVPILARNLQARLRATEDPELAGRLAQAGDEIFGNGPPFHRD